MEDALRGVLVERQAAMDAQAKTVRALKADIDTVVEALKALKVEASDGAVWEEMRQAMVNTPSTEMTKMAVRQVMQVTRVPFRDPCMRKPPSMILVCGKQPLILTDSQSTASHLPHCLSAAGVRLPMVACHVVRDRGATAH